MTTVPPTETRSRSVRNWAIISMIGLIALGAVLTRDRWWPMLMTLGNQSKTSNAKDDHAAGHAGHDHGHDHGGAESTNTLALSDQARQNLGLKVGTIEPQVFWKRIVVPGQVSNLPGHSERRINAMVQGTIAKVHVVQGQTVRAGDPLFEVQVTSELLASAQSNLLRILQDLELVQAEIKRLTPVSEAGAVSQKLLLEKEYEKRRLESARQVQLQELTIRGLTPAQVQTITEEKSLVRQFSVRVPESISEESSPENSDPNSKTTAANEQNSQRPHSSPKEDEVFVIEQMDVFPGKLVNPGDPLCDLALHTELQIRGEAFETESAQIYRAITEHWPVTAVFDLGDREPLTRDNLFILYASSVTNPQARSFEFFIPFTNEVIRDLQGPDGRSFRSWRFKPGQRAQLLVPVEQWTDRFVVPSEAVVSEGADSFVFKVNGKLLDRQAVVIEYRDARQTVIANDGSIFPGDEIAINQAYPLNLALKKAAGSGVDLHAGHNH